MQKVNATSMVKIIGTVLAVAVLAWLSLLPPTVAGKPAYKSLLDRVNLGLDLKGGLHVVMEAREKPGKKITSDTIQKSIIVLRNRVDNLGVAEPIIQAQGSNRVIVELPGVKDPEAAAQVLGKTAELEFRDMETGKVVVTGENLKDAKAEYDENQRPQVSLTFDSVGAKKFKDYTATHVGKRLGIYLDGELKTAPEVQSVIPNGQARITGGFEDLKAAEQTAALLRSGALPVTLEQVEKRVVGPTLGSDSLNKSVRAGIIGVLMILIFMIGYYRVPGVIAAVSLVLYSLLVLWIMVGLGATLTLYGIGGFILSIAMAVDANIIIYERIKDELRHGKTLQAAIEAGFNRAFWTIFDANLTTLIAAVVLFYFGTGTIKGFAITLSIGILTSMFTAITFTRFLLKAAADIFKNNKAYGV